MTISDPLLENPTLIGEDLRLRRSCKEDSEALAEFNGRIHGDDPQDSQRLADWTRDMLSGRHPTHHPDDFTIIEEVKSGKIVSAMNLISQVWQYGTVPMKVGRPEAVGTDPAYRGRGLVRTQFEYIHEWSRLRGEQMQAISGIPFYYRQFGYEMTVELDSKWFGYEATLPILPAGKTEPFRIRPAVEADVEFIANCYDLSTRRLRLSCQRDRQFWRYELSGKLPDNVSRLELKMIENRSGERIGFFAHPPFLDSEFMAVHWFALQPGTDWSSVTPSVLRHLWQSGLENAGQTGGKCLGYELALDSEHPACLAFAQRLPRHPNPYRWYIRVPDIVALLETVKPALEDHLSRSSCSGFTGELKIGQYTHCIKLTFQAGRIESIERYKMGDWQDSDGAFPALTFLQILFGDRSLSELEFAFADCGVKKDKRALVESLFPKQISHVLPIE
jgi:hypothetical protein